MKRPTAVAWLLGFVLCLAALWTPDLAAKWLLTLGIVAYATGIALDIHAHSRRRR